VLLPPPKAEDASDLDCIAPRVETYALLLLARSDEQNGMVHVQVARVNLMDMLEGGIVVFRPNSTSDSPKKLQRRLRIVNTARQLFLVRVAFGVVGDLVAWMR
jgi:hypothetical protein